MKALTAYTIIGLVLALFVSCTKDGDIVTDGQSYGYVYKWGVHSGFQTYQDAADARDEEIARDKHYEAEKQHEKDFKAVPKLPVPKRVAWLNYQPQWTTTIGRNETNYWLVTEHTNTLAEALPPDLSRVEKGINETLGRIEKGILKFSDAMREQNELLRESLKPRTPYYFNPTPYGVPYVTYKSAVH